MFLGTVPVDALFTIRVVWTPSVDSPAVTGSALSFVHEDGDSSIGPLTGTADGVNTFEVEHTSLPRAGRWRVHWVTTPPGGTTNDVVYVE